MSREHRHVDQDPSNRLLRYQLRHPRLANLVGAGEPHDDSLCPPPGFTLMRNKSSRTRLKTIQFHRYRIELNEPSWIVELRQKTNGTEAKRCRVRGPGKVEFRTALGRQDLESAFTLLNRRYCAAGLSTAFDQRMRILPFHFWSQTQVFMAIKNTQILGCITLITDDGPHDLPIHTLYPQTLASLHRRGERTGELCCLALESNSSESSVKLFGELTRRVVFFARVAGLTQITAVVHPRHAKFYHQAMGSKIIGDVSRQAHVEGNLGVPILCRVNDPSPCREKWRKFYFDGSFPVSEIERHPMSQIDREYFRRHAGLLPSVRRAA